MKIGFVGVGKLGFPCALALARRGHDVMGFDVSDAPYEWLKSRCYPYQEEQIDEYLTDTSLRMARELDELVRHAEIIFCAAQTPHLPEYEGSTPLPSTRADFDYSYLRAAVGEIANSCKQISDERKTLIVISTVLPGTCAREIAPLIESSSLRFAYNPYFIAMGTVIADFLAPEFVLCGCDDASALAQIEALYASITSSPVRAMSVKSAELTKVIYNTFITTKVTIANTVMELCERNGGDADDVMDALRCATDRIVGPKYMTPGMGDGGGCHPRDNIALSWLARKLGMTYDPWSDLMVARQRQTEWLARRVILEAAKNGLSITVLGKAFKAGTNIVTGSAAVLLKTLIEEYNVDVDAYDPVVDPDAKLPMSPRVFFVATDHAVFRTMPLPPGSVLLDPWGTAPDRPWIKTHRIGREA